MVVIRSFDTSDFGPIVNNLGEAERREVQACGMTPKEALSLSIRDSVVLWTGVHEEQPRVLFGVTKPVAVGGFAMPWMLATENLPVVKFLRASRCVFEGWKVLFPEMKNYVDERNIRTIGWLKWLGFKIEPPIPYGPYSRMFVPFTWGL